MTEVYLTVDLHKLLVIWDSIFVRLIFVEVGICGLCFILGLFRFVYLSDEVTEPT